jgi:hypothetical protein
MDADFKQRRSRRLRQIHNGVTSMVPAPGCFQPSHPSEILMPADPPQNHLDEHALIDLDEQFFDDPATGIGFQKGEWRSAIKPSMGFTQPFQSALTASIDRFRQGKNPDHAQHTVGFFYCELFPAGTAMLERSGGNHHRINFRPFQSKSTQAFNDRRSKAPFHNAQDVSLGGRRL